MRITVGNLDFNNAGASATPDGNGTYWYVTELEGWDSPGQRQSFDGPSSRHGGVLTESLLDVRSLIMRGVVKATSEANFWLAYYYLLGETNNLVVGKTMTVYETTPKTVKVVRASQPRITFVGVCCYTFEMPMLALNPLKKGTTNHTQAIAAGGSQTLTNVGTWQAAPVVTLTSQGTAHLKNAATGQLLTTGTRVLKNGSVIDFEDRTVYTGSANHYNDLRTDSEWWFLEPGDTTVQNTGSANVSVSYRDTWV